MKEPKILIGTREIAGYGGRLKKGFDEIGVKSAFVNFNSKYYNKKIPNNPPLLNLLNIVAQSIGRMFYKNITLRIIWLGFFQNFFGLFALLITIFRYNTFIFISNSTFFFFLELPLLRLFKKKIIYVFLGSESRPVYLNGYAIADSSVKSVRKAARLTRLQKKMIKVIERYADFIVNTPPQALLQEKPFINLFLIGMPIPVKHSSTFSQNKTDSATVRILHAPGKPLQKGSAIFNDVILRLKGKGYDIDYVMMTGVSNEKVLDEISKADLILDEIYSDTPMSMIAAEAASLGKPALVGSYYYKDIYNDLPANKVPPGIFVHPDSIAEELEKLVSNKELREAAGMRAFHFVSENWAAETVAGKFLQLIPNDYPAYWRFDPYKISYIYGSGLQIEKLKEIIKTLVGKKGIKSLCLHDKPELELKFKDLISG